MKHWSTADDALSALASMHELLAEAHGEAYRRYLMHKADPTLPESREASRRYREVEQVTAQVVGAIGAALRIRGLHTVVADIYAKNAVEAESGGHVGMGLGVVRQHGADGTEVLGMTHDASKKGAA